MRGGLLWGLAAALLAIAGAAVVISTYATTSQTWDEPAHLAAGIELLSRGVYDYEPQHPPLARAAAALLPYLHGMRSLGTPGIFEEGAALLDAAPDYERALTLARLGVLPFFVLLLAATWAWGRLLAGPVVATLAVFFLASLPPLIGNAAIAATDVPSVATLTFCFAALMAWLDRPRWPIALVLAVAGALALATKFSAIPFLGLVLAAWIVLRGMVGTARPVLPFRPLQYLAMLALAALVLWALFGFGLRPPTVVTAIPLGIVGVAAHNFQGHASYLLGQFSMDGWWYFYPVGFAVRTPPPLLFAGLAGLAWMTGAGIHGRDWRLLAVPVATVVLLVFVCWFSRINIGLRHAFVLYPMLALGAGYVCWRLARINWPGRIAVALLLAAQLASVLLAHPDHLAYFNLAARGQPEKILINGDLDWGQDLKRLAEAVRQRGIDEIAVAYNGSADPARFVPGFKPLPPETPTTGWIAISLFLTVDKSCGSYGWLDAYPPAATVGASIRLYRIDALKPDVAVPRGATDPENPRCRRLAG
ncbi:MAG: hypothetical protein RIM84_25520 [Alphaproteobacteria bacterium]